MDLSQIKMVVTDMDGTLLNSNHEVSGQFFSLFERLRKKNIQFVAASGRQYNSIVDKLQPIKDDIIVIAENGGFAIDNGEEIVSTPLPIDTRNNVLSILEQIGDNYPVLCGKYAAYISDSSPKFEKMLREYYTEFEIIDDLKSYTEETMKIAVYHFVDSEKYIYPAVKHLEDYLKVKVSGENWVDVSSLKAHKGYALKKVMERYNVRSNEVLIFGDYNNDIEMLQLSDFSFAMANAHPNVKKVAQYETLSNDELGVEKVLEKLT
ncbi:HAD family hydrolase [Allomuricauda sp. SCSIO 65647]|uniref:HAD family hydrolase n=1 Tax=Allomuricauda sp. SCSIO 65647 TaxID=2908843 RepID=UPI001F3EC568|nr:HAD family hydrolase [Muricauda sp. SCSIO 65647]UJH67962.1 Cof-type HAD-IIB family hydrolase [Muricauda sp. SCSIO 65647]